MTDPFTTLGLPRLFDLTNGQVESAYLSRSAMYHTDLVGDDVEAIKASAELNDARAIILHPESRANALLAVLGGPSKEQDRSLPDGFLVEIMETREELDSVMDTGSPEEVASWKEWAWQQRANYAARISNLFRLTPLPVLEIRRQLNAWRYIERLIEQLVARKVGQSGMEGEL